MENAHAPILSAAAIMQFFDLYQPPDADPAAASPLLAVSHAGLPRTSLQIAGADPLRDEGVAYAEVLRKDGTEVRECVYEGYPHGFMRIAYLQGVKEARHDTNELLAWLLLVPTDH